MEADALVRILQLMTPTGAVLVGDCVLWPHDSAQVDEEELRRDIARTTTTFVELGLGAEEATARARERIESDHNRRFVQAELEHLGVRNWTATSLMAVADVWASLVRATVAKVLPDRDITVEVLGAEDEPLEIAVTFYSARSHPGT